MTDRWQSLSTAPRDGTVVRLARIAGNTAWVADGFYGAGAWWLAGSDRRNAEQIYPECWGPKPDRNADAEQ